ncbi:hypothetical protein [Halovenus marina]|uniref:hypothetical protein n=1 Tax=Halovenus marina TaxID=3396621 RepID=UPI003F558DBD
MSRYERAFGTDWDSLDKTEAIERAYALGVATTLGEYHPDELDALRAEMNSAYDRSVLDLAFDEGKNEGRDLSVERSDPEDEQVWAELVGEGDPDGTSTGGRTGLPESLSEPDVLDRPNLDHTDAVERPSFLDKD